MFSLRISHRKIRILEKNIKRRTCQDSKEGDKYWKKCHVQLATSFLPELIILEFIREYIPARNLTFAPSASKSFLKRAILKHINVFIIKNNHSNVTFRESLFHKNQTWKNTNYANIVLFVANASIKTIS